MAELSKDTETPKRTIGRDGKSYPARRKRKASKAASTKLLDDAGNAADATGGGSEAGPRPANSGRNPDGTFAKGNSINLAGKPKGTRHRATVIAEQLIDAQGELLVTRALEMAVGGNEAAMRMCLDRLIAPRKERPVSFALPKIQTAADVVAATNAIAEAVASGELMPTEAASMSTLVGNAAKAIELHELEARIVRLEEQAIMKGRAP